MNVTVVWATAGVQDIVAVALPQGATVADAVAQSRIIETYMLDATQLRFAVFGRRAAAEAPLGDGDRVEITRPLQADPKEARRRRARVASKARDPQSR
jgi:putative ubiquitin-RnfH superfamily antitoxin RatB of RatAB toxin-antitoxin module